MSGADFRVKVTVRNANLLRAIESAGLTCGGKAAAQMGVPYVRLLAYANLQLSPLDDDGMYRDDALALCVFLKREPSQLWSEDQLEPLVKSSFEVEADKAALMGLINPHAVEGTGFVDPDGIAALLATLPERIQNVLRMRLGFDTTALTLDRTADALGVSRERVRQIEAKGLRMLRHPDRRHLINESCE